MSVNIGKVVHPPPRVGMLTCNTSTWQAGAVPDKRETREIAEWVKVPTAARRPNHCTLSSTNAHTINKNANQSQQRNQARS